MSVICCESWVLWRKHLKRSAGDGCLLLLLKSISRLTLFCCTDGYVCVRVCVCISRECKCTPTHRRMETHTQKIQWIISRAFAHKFAGVKGGGWKWGARGFELLELTNVSSRSKTLRPGDCSIWGQHYRANTRHRNTKWEKVWKRQDQREKRPVDRFGEIFLLQDKSHLWPDHLSFYVHFCRVVRR